VAGRVEPGLQFRQSIRVEIKLRRGGRQAPSGYLEIYLPIGL
jgi:hypothetical protein